MNDVKDTAEWTPDGTCAVPPGTTAVLGYELEWLVFTGWELASNFFSYGASCGAAFSESRVHFNNGVFCNTATASLGFAGPTDTYFEPNRVDGLPDLSGGATFLQNIRIEGGCKHILSERRSTELVRVN